MSVNMLVRLTAHRLRGRRLRSSLGFVVSPVAVIGALPSCEAAPCRRGSRWGFTRGPGPTVYAIPVLGAGGRREEKKLPGNPGASEMADKLMSADPHHSGSAGTVLWMRATRWAAQAPSARVPSRFRR